MIHLSRILEQAMKVMPNVGDLIKHSKEGFAIITERRFIEEGAEDEFLLVWIDPKTKCGVYSTIVTKVKRF